MEKITSMHTATMEISWPTSFCPMRSRTSYSIYREKTAGKRRSGKICRRTGKTKRNMMNKPRNLDISQTIPGIRHAEHGQFFLLAGPCVVENRDLVLKTAAHIQERTSRLHIPFVFKASYRKANRSRADSFAGIGDEKALKILSEVHRELDV